MNKDAKILIACEESGIVTEAFIKKGFTNVWSCDLLPTSGNYPDHHLQQDVTELLKEHWDMIIAFPPCTDLAVSGAAWFEKKRKDGRQKKSIDFFMLFANLKIPYCIENPVGIMSTLWRKPDQIVQPYEFGHMEQKKTCFWINKLPLLKPTKNVYNEMMLLPKNQRERLHYLPPGPERAKLRSKTFPGIAKAMADQWTGEDYE